MTRSLSGKTSPSLALGLGLALLLGCSGAGPADAREAGDGSAPDTVVAKIGSETISRSELEEAAKEHLEELDWQRYQTLLAVLNQLVERRLVEAEAGARGVPPEQLFRQEVVDKAAPTDAELDALLAQPAYQRRLESELAGATTDEEKAEKRDTFRSRLRELMQQNQANQRRREFMAELKAAHPVAIDLPPPEVTRVEVALGESPVRGAEDAPVTIVEFSDFECPYCGRAQGTLEDLLTRYPGKVRLVYKHFPLSFHKHAPKAGEAAECAREQGKFWEMHDQLYQHQRELEPAQLTSHAEAIGLDVPKFQECLDSGRMAPRLQRDMAEGEQAGVSSTPFFFVNGRKIKGAQPVESFAAVIDAELAG